MIFNYKLVSLFICCLTEEALRYSIVLAFISKHFSDVESTYVIRRIDEFVKNPKNYVEKLKELLESETNENIASLILELEIIVKNYACQMEQNGLAKNIIYQFEKHFRVYK